MTLEIKINFDAAAELAKDIDGAADLLAIAGVAAVNKVALTTFEKSKATIGAQVNLGTDYIASKMSLTQATIESPFAIITGAGRGTVLTRFNATQIMTASKNPKRSKGFAARGIPAGSKSAGVSVRVKVGGSGGIIARGFLVPMRAGSVSGGNGLGVFTRRGDKITQRYGPSVDQVFRGVIKSNAEEFASDLEKQVLIETEAQIKKAIK